MLDTQQQYILEGGWGGRNSPHLRVASCPCGLFHFLPYAALPFGFEQNPYSFEEADMLVDMVLVTKGDVVSEQNHSLLVVLSFGTTELGKCINVIMCVQS